VELSQQPEAIRAQLLVVDVDHDLVEEAIDRSLSGASACSIAAYSLRA